MSKILQNTTGSAVTLTDVGVTIPASTNYTIDPNDYLLFAASSNTITEIGNGTLTVSDGSNTLSIANGTALIQGIYPTTVNALVNDGFGNPINSTVVDGRKALTVDLARQADIDTFGTGIIGSRIPMITADFSLPLASNNVTTTVTASGTVTQSSGSAVIATGTTTTASAKLTSVQTTAYFPTNESYAAFTAAYTTSVASSFQRVGYYDANNGYWVGYSGTTFGIAMRVSGTDNFIAQSDFNIDTLTGAAGSLFTANAVPQVLNPLYKNIFRIRLGWLGAASIIFEILAPDGNWIVFHKILIPNTQVAPSTPTSPSWPLTAEAIKTSAGSSNLEISISCWTAGTVDIPNGDLFGGGTITTAGSTGATGYVIANIINRNTVVFDITGTWVATIMIQGQNGDGNWQQIDGIGPQNNFVSNITNNLQVAVNCAGYTQVRLYASSYTSGTAQVNWDVSRALSVVQSFSSPIDGSKDTFSVSAQALTVAANATDIFTITGSATKTIRVLRIGFGAIQTTAAYENVILLKRSTANTGGTSTTLTAVPHDSQNYAATATVRSYTANPTIGTLVGNLRSYKIYITNTTPNAGTSPSEWKFGDGPDQGIVLRGTGEVFAINLGGTSWAGSSIDIYVEWTEE